MDIELPIEKVADFIEQDLHRIEKELLLEIKKEVELKTPVDTGELKSGWQIDGNSLVNEVPYAGYIETGTIYQRPVGMVTTTLHNVDAIIKRIVQ